MSVTLRPQLLDNISISYAPEGSTSDDLTIGLNAAHLTDEILDANSTAPATKAVVREYSLTAGALTIDLTSLLGAFGEAVTGLGLKPQYLHILNPQNNSNLVFATGATNGITLPGGGWTTPGSTAGDVHEVRFYPEVIQDVASGDRTIDVTGTSNQSFTLALVFG